MHAICGCKVVVLLPPDVLDRLNTEMHEDAPQDVIGHCLSGPAAHRACLNLLGT